MNIIWPMSVKTIHKVKMRFSSCKFFYFWFPSVLWQHFVVSTVNVWFCLFSLLLSYLRFISCLRLSVTICMNDERTASVLVIKKKTQVLASLTADYKWFVFFIPFTVIDIITEEFLKSQLWEQVIDNKNSTIAYGRKWKKHSLRNLNPWFIKREVITACLWRISISI